MVISFHSFRSSSRSASTHIYAANPDCGLSGCYFGGLAFPADSRTKIEVISNGVYVGNDIQAASD